MSFFGFDTSLPRDRDRDRTRERDEQDGDLDFGLGASAQEDVEVYTWGEEAYDDLADRLQEDGDDLNQDTFGDVDQIDNNFDFTSTGRQSNQQQQQIQTGKNDDKFKSNSLDDFWTAPSTSSGFATSSKPTSQSYDPFGGVSLAPVPGLAPSSSSFGHFQNQPSNTSQPQSQGRPPLTLEEVEAELRASRSQQQQQGQAQGPAPVAAVSDGRRALTLEEVEAQMLAQRTSSQPQPQQLPPSQQQQQPSFNDFPPVPPQFQGLPPHIAALLAQQPPNLSPQQREQLLGVQLQQLQQSGMLGPIGGVGGINGNDMMGVGINGPIQGGGGMNPLQAPSAPPHSASSPVPPIQAQASNQRTGTPKAQQETSSSLPSFRHKSQQSSSGGAASFLTNPSHFPPLGSNAPSIPTNARVATPTLNPLQQLMNGSAQPVQSRNGPMMPNEFGGIPPAPIQLGNLSNASANAAILQAQAAQEQNARMRNLLNSLPKVLQARLLNQVPPYVQFETLDLLVRNLPLLVGLSFDEEEEKLLDLQSQLKEGKSLKEELQERLKKDGLNEIEGFRIQAVLKKIELLDDSNRLIDSILKREDLRRKIAAKIQGMSRYNNLMTTSDKDFITRIQVSQLVTPDPYADDFYAHIYFALRGGGPGAAVAAASAGITSGNKSDQTSQEPPKGPRRGRQRGGGKVKETAMQRMQAQVERLVANRKARDGERELASLAAAAGATNRGGAPSSSEDDSNPKGKGNNPTSATAGSSSSSSTPSSPAVSNLGKVTSASSKNPRQLLQISAREVREERLKREGKLGEAAVTDGSATEAVRAALAGASLGEGAGRAELSNGGKREPLTKFETLRILEKLYDTVLALEQMRRTIPQAPLALQIQQNQDGTPASQGEEQEKYEKQMKEWQTEQENLTTTLWKELRILEPLEISNPHPFVSLLNTSKGKRLFPRALRHLSPEQVLTSLTMIVCNFGSLDVVKLSPYLDLSDGGGLNGSNLNEKQKLLRMEARRQTEAFASSIIPVILSEMANAPMRIVCGMLALFMDQHDVLRVAKSKPGIALLTMFLSRGELLRQGGSAASGVPNPTPEELDQWVQVFSLLFARLSGKEGSLVSLFPSTRIKESLPFGQAAYYSLNSDPQRNVNIDLEDEPVWNLMATLAISASMEQQHTLVQQLREKILENVVAAKRERENVAGLNGNGNLADEGNDLRIRNVNLLLHALNLDASQITA